MILCECGCGQEVKPGRRFVRGHNRYWAGKKRSNDTKAKISGTHKKNKKWLGRRHTEATKKKISINMIGKQNALGYCPTNDHRKKISEMLKGENNPSWQGGVSFEPYCHKFNEEFKEFIRDKFCRVCFLCGNDEETNGRKLDVHHVNYDKSCLCSEVECEFVPLCISCHAKTNHNRNYYEKLLLEKLGSENN